MIMLILVEEGFISILMFDFGKIMINSSIK